MNSSVDMYSERGTLQKHVREEKRYLRGKERTTAVRVGVARLDAQHEVLGHVAGFDRLDDHVLQRLRERAKLLSANISSADGTRDKKARIERIVARTALLSSLARCRRPRVQAKMEATGFVLVSLPCWCSL
jgi:hypothetical protein